MNSLGALTPTGTPYTRPWVLSTPAAALRPATGLLGHGGGSGGRDEGPDMAGAASEGSSEPRTEQAACVEVQGD